jgi:hypothetical protein
VAKNNPFSAAIITLDNHAHHVQVPWGDGEGNRPEVQKSCRAAIRVLEAAGKCYVERALNNQGIYLPTMGVGHHFFQKLFRAIYEAQEAKP